MSANRMTEAEAAGKWCPFARITNGNDGFGNFNRYNGDRGKQHCEQEAPCLGSRCMAWRWAPVERAEIIRHQDKAVPPAGYCGLAGDPR